MSDPFCPKHGRASRPITIPGNLRCELLAHCLATFDVRAPHEIWKGWKMTPSEYLQASARTEYTPDFIPNDLPGSFYARLMHAVMGLVTEAGELEEALDRPFDRVNFIEELGDIEWYIALACRTLDLDLAAIDLDVEARATSIMSMPYVSHRQVVSRIVMYSARLMDQLKKYLIYEKIIDKEQFIAWIIAVSANVEVGARLASVTMAEVRERNIAKLRKRYPDKFTSEKAINRDLAEERKALEQSCAHEEWTQARPGAPKVCDRCAAVVS